MIEQSAEAGMIGSCSVHDALGTIFTLRNASRVPRPLVSAWNLGKYVTPAFLIGKTKFVGSDADNLSVFSVDFSSVLRKATRPLPIILYITMVRIHGPERFCLLLEAEKESLTHTHGVLLMRQ
jgi:hypothetical protein